MNLIKIVFFLLLVSLFALTNADSGQGQNNITEKSEEELCFDILNEKVRQDPRFSNLNGTLLNRDLSEVLYNEQDGSTIDISTYDKFKNYMVRNKFHNTQREEMGLLETDFFSRRTNIATVIGSSPFIISQVVGFGQDSNFDFPVESRTDPFGDKYLLDGDWFKEFVVYTHHSITGEFLSCGIFHLTPLGDRNYGNVSEAGYFTNTLTGNENQAILGGNKCNSGFDGSRLNRQGKEFYEMKTNICTLDYSQRDFVRQEILAVAYNNNSTFFNEYLTFQLQVEAMRNTDHTSGGLVSIRETFDRYLHERTCLSFFQTNENRLPSGCERTHSSDLISYNINQNTNRFNILNLFVPQALGAREFNFSQEYIEEASGMVVFDNLPYHIYQDIQRIENENFKNFLKLALSPTLENFIQYRRDNGIVITPYEQTFMSCGLSYRERQDIIIDLIEGIDDIKDFDIASIEYTNPKFGDCIIPYPDIRNRNKVIEGSFESNQLLAKQISGIYEGEDLDEGIIQYTEKVNKITIEHQNRIDELTRNFNEGKISGDELNELIENERDLYSKSLIEVENSFTKGFINTNIDTNTGGIQINKGNNNGNTFYYVLLLLLGLTIIIIGILLKRK